MRPVLKSPDVLFAMFPVAILISIYLYFIASKLVLGYWPTPYHPDPKTDILMDRLGGMYHFITYFYAGSVFSILVYVALLPYRYFYHNEKHLLVKVCSYSCIWIGALLWFYIDPFSIFEWFLD